MLKHLATGGMADVWLARSDGIEGFERHVVLKRIRPELARDQRFIRMFLDEARVAATLHHQHIVQVHDVCEVGGEYFIAMEYVHGEDVRKILSSASKQRTHVPLGYAVAIVSSAAAGLNYAHERRGTDRQPLNIVHRDVSPSNILVGYDGAIKVVDFGIATASMRQETRSGSLKGKLSYMSPEQCRGIPVDRRTDVYALGVVLYELATTTRMIKGENDYLVMEQIVHGRIAPPQSRRPSLPTELSEIIMRALATDRERRYPTADDLRIALDQFAGNAGLTASSSAIASYMRQQFGQRPEPWLEVGPSAGLDEVPTSIEESMPSNSWTELPRLDDMRRTTSSIPRQSGPIGVIPTAIAADPTKPIGVPQRPSVTPLPGTTPPTHSRMGWESQPRTPVARSIPIQKIAIASGALIAGIAIWLVVNLLTSHVTPSPAPALAQPAPPPPGVTTAVPSPAAPPPATEAAATGAGAAAPAAPSAAASAAASGAASVAAPAAATVPSPAAAEVAKRDPDPAPSRKARSAAPATTRVATRTTADPPTAPAPKQERPTRVAAASPQETSRSEPAPADSELHRPAPAAPPPPPLSVTQPAPAEVTPPTPAPAAVAPQVVAPAALDANRIAGDKSITPDETTMDAIGRSGKDTLVSSYKVCITADGSINTVTQLRSTGFPAYDAKIQNTIRKDWRYKPYLVNGKPTPVCTAFRFIYSQK